MMVSSFTREVMGAYSTLLDCAQRPKSVRYWYTRCCLQTTLHWQLTVRKPSRDSMTTSLVPSATLAWPSVSKRLTWWAKMSAASQTFILATTPWTWWRSLRTSALPSIATFHWMLNWTNGSARPQGRWHIWPRGCGRTPCWLPTLKCKRTWPVFSACCCMAAK